MPAQAGHNSIVVADVEGGTAADLRGEVEARAYGGNFVGSNDDACAAIDIDGPVFTSYPV